MFIAKIKRFLGFGLLLALSLGISTNYLWAAEAAGGSGGGGHGAGGGAGDVNPYAALSQAEKDAELLRAAKKGYLGIVRSLLANGADVDLQTQMMGSTALMSAVLYGHLEVVRLLLAAGENVNLQRSDGVTALMMAAQDGHVEVVRLLLANGADMNMQNQFGYSALIFAAQRGHLDAVRLLLANGADVNLQDRNGDTALMEAAIYGRVEVVRLLLAAGANVNLQTRNGDTALTYAVLMMATYGGHLEVVRLLLENGANVNLQRPDGGTALMFAAREGHLEVVRLLLANGANVDLQAIMGSTPLMMAAQNEHLEVVRLLLINGANVNLQRQDGATALIFAALREHPEIIQLLLAAGADVPAAGRLSVEQNARIQTILAELVERKAEFLAAAATGNIAQINRLIDLPIRGDRKLVINQALLALAGSETDISAADFERILAILLAHGADIEFRDTVETGGFREAKGAAAASVSDVNYTALELAIKATVPNRVDALLMAGANPEKLSESIRIYLANASLAADLAIKEIAKMIENANMARAMLISPDIFKRFTLNIGLDQDNTLDPVLRYLFQWEEQENDRAKRAGRVRMLATPLPPDKD